MLIYTRLHKNYFKIQSLTTKIQTHKLVKVNFLLTNKKYKKILHKHECIFNNKEKTNNNELILNKNK